MIEPTLGLRQWVLRILACIVVFSVSLGGDPVRAADSFYEALLQKGTDAYARGDFHTAVRQLRIACFGFLDEPPLLSEGLVRLGLAQAGAGDREGVLDTFNRLSEVERRFQAYRTAKLPVEVRTAFEKTLIGMIPEDRILDGPFSFLIPTPEQRLALLPPQQRRKEIENRVKQEPREIKWLLMLADLALALNEPKACVKWADAALAIRADNLDARCLRGQALVSLKEWAKAVSDCGECVKARPTVKAAENWLLSLSELKRYPEVIAGVAGLPSRLQSASSVADLLVRASKAIKEIEAQAARSAAKQPPNPTPPKMPTPALTPIPTPTHPPSQPKPGVTPTAIPATPTPGLVGKTSNAPVALPAATPTAKPLVRRESSPAPTGVANPQGIDLTQPPAPNRKPPLAAADQETLRRAQDWAARGQLGEALELARNVADRNPEVSEAQFVAAELAYRVAGWATAVAYFQRGGPIADDQPLRLFYLAVCFYETGERKAARETLQRCLLRLKRTKYVDQYVAKILSAVAGTTPGTTP